MTAGDVATWEGEIVRALFINQTEITAGAFPLRAVWCNTSALRTVVREEMREFVA